MIRRAGEWGERERGKKRERERVRERDREIVRERAREKARAPPLSSQCKEDETLVSASERRGNKLNAFNDLYLKAKARIWP